MDAGKVLGRGMSFPPRVGPDGRVAWSEGEANVRESIRVILMTDLRERIMLPEFGGGLAGYLFEPNTVTTRHQIRERIARALERWEPRVEVESISVEQDPGDAEAAVATVVYKLVATRARERVSLGITLARLRTCRSSPRPSTTARTKTCSTRRSPAYPFTRPSGRTSARATRA